jgi:RNA polymerase sigma factor (sigma-70 family)
MGDAKTDRRQDSLPGDELPAQDSLLKDELPEEDPAHHTDEVVFDSAEINVHLANEEFQRKLDTVCKAVFRQFGASPRYSEWLDLRQEVLISFYSWLHKYKGTATLKSVLNRIATNLCIDEFHRQDAKIRAHVEINFEELNLETLRSPFAGDIDARILFEECRNHLSGAERVIFDEFFTEDRSLSEIARRHGFSQQTVVNKFGSIISKIRSLVLEPRKFVEGGIPNESGTRTNAGLRRQRSVANRLPTSAAKIAEGKLEQMLLASGLLSEIPPRITDFTPYRNRKPVKIKGKPVSDTIIEERR